jgi:hypothetical protein
MKTLCVISALMLALGTIALAQKKTAADAVQIIHEMQDSGLVRTDVDARKAWVSPAFWLSADAQGKENLTAALAMFVSPKNPMVTVYDMQSGKQIASYGPFQGFRVY